MTRRYAMVRDDFRDAFRAFIERGRFPRPNRGEYLECTNMFTTDSSGAHDEAPRIEIRRGNMGSRDRWSERDLQSSLKGRWGRDDMGASANREFGRSQSRSNSEIHQRRPEHHTREFNNCEDEDFAGYGDLEDFVRERLTPADFAQFRELLEGVGERTSDTPDEGQDRQLQRRVAGRIGAHGPRSRVSGVAGQAKDRPSSFKGMAKPGSRMSNDERIDTIAYALRSAFPRLNFKQRRQIARTAYGLLPLGSALLRPPPVSRSAFPTLRGSRSIVIRRRRQSSRFTRNHATTVRS